MSNLMFPVVGGGARITSVMGPRNVAIGSRNHGGIDIAANRGTPIIAPTDLTITRSGWENPNNRGQGFGLRVSGVDAQGREHYLGHMDTVGVQVGQKVSMGTQLGTVGTTGRSSGNHLHYGIKSGGKWIDPIKNGLSVGKEAMDMAKDVAKDAMKKAGDVAKKAAVEVAAGVANSVIPGSGEVLKSVIGDGEKSLFEQFKDWLKDTGFFQRLALAFFGFILLFGALMLMKSNTVQNILGKGK